MTEPTTSTITTTPPLTAQAIPIPIPSSSSSSTSSSTKPIIINNTSTTPKEPGVFGRLVRSLSRSSPRSNNPPKHNRKASNSIGQSNYSPSLATSPPPDSYFPPPPAETINCEEASGRGRHPESRGARAIDVGSQTQGFAAPGVSFAPANSHRAIIPDEELESWVPAPRRSASQRAQRVKSVDGKASRDVGGLNGAANSNGGSNGVGGPPLSGRTGLARARAVSNGTAVNGSNSNSNEIPPIPTNNSNLNAGDRKGVQLEDKVLSRSTSVKRALTAVKRGMERSIFAPTVKAEGEKRCLILVADGSEEIEVFTPFDVFVRASLNPVLVSVSPLFSPSQSLPYLTLSRGARILVDTQFETLKQEHKDDFDAIIIPGGAKGAERLSQDPDVQKLIWQFHQEGKLVGVICAGALAAKTSGIAEGKRITSHPTVKDQLEKHYIYSEDSVVISDNLVSSRGPGTALAFSLAIVEILAGKAKRDEVESPMMII